MSEPADKFNDKIFIHLGTFDLSGKGPGAYVGGIVKLRQDPERDLLSEAGSFLKAANRCLNGCKEEQGIEMLTTPGAVCAAFSCELFLKFIIMKERSSQPRTHELDKLFKICSAEAQTAIVETRPDIPEILERNSKHFVGARYHHESEQFSFRQQELLQTAEFLSQFVRERFNCETA